MKFFYSFLPLALGTVLFLSFCIGCSNISQPTEKEIASKISLSESALAYSNALAVRDARKMFEAAQRERGKDAETASEMFRKAGLYAALQQNKTLFSEILVIEPTCAEYKHFIAKGKSPSLLPQIYPVKKLVEVRVLKEDQLAQWDLYIAECYPQLSGDDLNNVIAQVNDARRNMNAKELSLAASLLSGKKIQGSIPVQLAPAGLLKEAMQLAEISSDKKAMEESIQIAESKKILSSRDLREAKQILKAMSATRAYRVNIKTKSNVRGRTVYHNGVRYTKIELADGTEIEIIDDGDEDQKRKDVRKLLSNEDVNKMFNRLVKRKGVNFRFHIPPRSKEVTITVKLIEQASAQSDVSFGQGVQQLLYVAESGKY